MSTALDLLKRLIDFAERPDDRIPVMKPRWRWALWNCGLWLHWYGWCRREWISNLGGWLMRVAAPAEWFGGKLDAPATGEVPF
jgi:hypothetical protein